MAQGRAGEAIRAHVRLDVVAGPANPGGRDARLFLRTAYSDGMAEAGALSLAVSALVAAAEEDTATGGPDPARGIYPTLVTVTADGYRELDEDTVAEISRSVLEGRS